MSCNQVQHYKFLHFNKSTLICHLHIVNYQWRVLKAPSLSSSQYNEIPYQRYGHTAVADNHLVCSLLFSLILDHILDSFINHRFTFGEDVTVMQPAILYFVTIPTHFFGPGRLLTASYRRRVTVIPPAS